MIHQRKVLAAVAALMLTTLAVGCQMPVQTDGQPKVIVKYGDIDILPQADLAVVLNFGQTTSTPNRANYSLASLADSGIAQVKVKVTGPNIVGDVNATVQVDPTTCTATANFMSLPPGPVTITVNALDASGNIVSWGTGSAEIKPGQTSEADISCSTSQPGNLLIHFSCGACGASPSPTPTPVPPVNTSSLAPLAADFDVDPNGNVYIMGGNPQIAPGTPGHGCIVKVDTAGNASILVRSPFQDDDIASTGTDLFRLSQTYFYDYSFQSGATQPISLPSGYPAGGGQSSITRTYTGSIEYGSYTSGVTRFYNQDGTLLGADNSLGMGIHECTIDPAGLPIFATGMGSIAEVLLPNKSIDPFVWRNPTGQVAAICSLGPGSTQYFITRSNDTNVELWDSTNPGILTPVLPIRSGFQWDSFIRRRDNGTFYIFGIGVSSNGGGRLWSNTYFIASYNYDPVAKKLVNEHIIVDAHP